MNTSMNTSTTSRYCQYQRPRRCFRNLNHATRRIHRVLTNRPSRSLRSKRRRTRPRTHLSNREGFRKPLLAGLLENPRNGSHVSAYTFSHTIQSSISKTRHHSLEESQYRCRRTTSSNLRLHEKPMHRKQRYISISKPPKDALLINPILTPAWNNQSNPERQQAIEPTIETGVAL